jgi:flagellar motor switch protein FliN/FliY
VRRYEMEEKDFEGMNLELLLDIPLELSVELGRRRLPLRELLNLRKGSIVELEKEASEPFDILVNGQPVAKGEIVVQEEKLGVRILEIISPAERIRKLK